VTSRVGRARPQASCSADRSSRLLWFAGVVAVALAASAFVLWTRNGAGILLDMMLALCL
jgi:hypothetical protein